ncbi:hypothetical protein RchiOBHm_Chr4g0409481 [Rosa chinensis]|uniref:Uncharacterized protein n=1 Tax=Rosa chinensis TaxID=74649 RepID=A0A2P6QV35_ROSCH|nr:hypothetical protein RchiOBHm_Chr4g0409481 [Rosa chinensis]
MVSPAYDMHLVDRHPSYVAMVEVGRYLVGRLLSHALQKALREVICVLCPTSEM